MCFYEPFLKGQVKIRERHVREVCSRCLTNTYLCLLFEEANDLFCGTCQYSRGVFI